MADNDQFRVLGARAQDGAIPAEYDEGLRGFMLRVYNYMAIGIGVTGVVALAFGMAMESNVALQQLMLGTPLKWVIMFAPLAFILVLSFGIHKLSVPAATGLFYLFATVMGVSISWIFLVFTNESIAQLFFVTAIMFGALSLYGYTTKRDLSGLGQFMFMGLIGVIIAVIVNLFLQSSALAFAINIIGIIVFAGLTVYDNQRLKQEYYQLSGDGTMLGRAAIFGALSLYLNFVNMFMMMLQLLGSRE
ncbi:MAG: Bax inhibitor-1/YccA family protein [Pseudomonadota bacterium]